jgi:hypothetical protein
VLGNEGPHGLPLKIESFRQWKKPKRLLRVALYKEGNGPMEICAAISHEGEIWLVPDWIRSPRGRSAKPLRMIPLSKFPHKVFRKLQKLLPIME